MNPTTPPPTSSSSGNSLECAGGVGWQPISAAPKDGRWLLVYGTVWAGEISGIARNQTGEVGIARYNGGKSDFPGDWWDKVGGDAYACWCQPTHWMPLPAAPTLTNGGPHA